MASKKSAKAAEKTESNASYDEVPYESFTYPQTHPRHLSVVGRLFGLSPPDFRTARVLEIGCASGGNLFPAALAYPKAHFTGIDYSAAQIALAEEQRKALDASNIEFRHEDVLAFDLKKNKGKFDYIICHGVFSWVPENVRDKVLAICDEALSPNGLALVSYNTLPGWNAVRGLRDMMLFHTGRFTTPQEKVAQARALLDFLAESIPEANASYRALIENERSLLKDANDTYLYHDHLESVNAQFYLHEFVRAANAHGLTYVGDAAYATMFVDNMHPKVLETLKALDDVVAQEQYMDFINNRRFRSSILCRAGAKPNRALRPEQILDYYVSSLFGPEKPDPDLSGDVAFKAFNGATFTTHDRPTAELFMEIVRCGKKPEPVRDVIARVQKRLKTDDPKLAEKIMLKNGLQMVLRDWIALHPDTVHFAMEISEKPVAAPIARYQAGKNVYRLTNALNGPVQTGDIVNTIVHHLDGTRTRADIVEILIERASRGLINVARDGQPLTDPADVRRSLVQIVDETLPKLAIWALLVG